MAPLGFWDRPAASIILGGVACALLLASTISPDMFSDVRARTANTVSPLIEALSYPFQATSETVRRVTGLSDIQARNAALEQENLRLRQWYQTALAMQDKNMALEKLLNVKVEPAHDFVTARIIADAGNAFVKSVLVRAGQDDGVQKGNPAVSGDGLVGRVIGVGRAASRILLLNDVNSRVPVMIEETDQHAILAGQNLSRPFLDHVSKDASIASGMRVVTSGFGGMFPAGIPVGIVQETENGQFEVRLFSSLDTTHFVRIIMVHDDPNLVEGKLE